MLSEKVTDCLMCPVCHGTPLGLMIDEIDGERIVRADLTCSDCKRRYPVRNDIPVMMPPDLGSNLIAGNERWGAWGTAMERFLQWREAAWEDPDEAAQRRENAREMHGRFIEFCALPDGPADLLDVGCGTGHIADLLPRETRYVGVDPLPGGRAPTGDLPPEIPVPMREVSFIQAVGEFLPIRDGSFDVVLMMGTLDHAQNPEEALSQAARVLRRGGTLGVLLGLAQAEDGGIGGAFRSLMKSLTGKQDSGVRETHLRSFSSPDEVATLLSSHFEVLESMQYENRVFVRAAAVGESE